LFLLFSVINRGFFLFLFKIHNFIINDFLKTSQNEKLFP
jgi:hypothetical protein